MARCPKCGASLTPPDGSVRVDEVKPSLYPYPDVESAADFSTVAETGWWVVMSCDSCKAAIGATFVPHGRRSRGDE